jgi:hypothetical protein
MSKEDNSARRVRYGGKGGRHHHGMMPGEKPKDFKRTMKTLGQ